MIWLFWFRFCIVFMMFFDVLELRFFVGLLVRMSDGLWMIVFVMVVCWCWFLDILNVCLLSRFLILSFVVMLCSFFFMIDGVFFFSVNGSMIFLLIVSVFRRLKFWNINLSCFLWKWVSFVCFSWCGFFLWIRILFEFGWLIVEMIFNSVVFFELDGFIIVVNLFFFIENEICFKVW